jgi:hypothetical protein
VTIEAEYSVEEYDILILSAEQNGGLETWLIRNGYRIPDGVSEILASYIRQKMRFFVAKVDLEEHASRGFKFMRPLSVAYETPKFMLPIRLGTVNADGPQELFIYALTRKGRVETTNYRTVKIPSDMDIPLYVRDEFKDFYRLMFDTVVRKDKRKTVSLEYAWDMNWCDPCAADPLSDDELKQLGVYWINGETGSGDKRLFRPQPQAKKVFVTRLHVRYDAEHFPDDLRFQKTGDRSNFQGRYVMRHPWKGKENDCDKVGAYLNPFRKGSKRKPGHWQT